jgi:hypothetical protein
MANRESAAVAIWVKAGGRYKPKKISGVSHFLEHMLFQGCKGYPGTAVADTLGKAGCSVNAYTSFDRTVYHAKGGAEKLPLILEIYGLSDEATRLGRMILIYHSICAMLIWAPSFTMPYDLRAANDVAPTMIISIISMWVFRVVSSYILGDWMGLGLFGVWIAMSIDWLFRTVCFIVRYKREKWVVKSS